MTNVLVVIWEKIKNGLNIDNVSFYPVKIIINDQNDQNIKDHQKDLKYFLLIWWMPTCRVTFQPILNANIINHRP